MTYTKHFLFALTLSGSLLGAEPVLTKPEAQLTIRIYDYADTEPKLLERSVRQAASILRQAGVHPAWQNCTQGAQDASCSNRAGAHVIQFRIHPQEMAKKLTQRTVEFGYSLPLEGGHGVIGGVYLERTLREAGEIGLAPHVMLGHTIAHEIGHLLLGTNSHAQRGIMRPTWTKREVHQAKTGLFGFTKAQARQIKRSIDARLLLAAD